MAIISYNYPGCSLTKLKPSSMTSGDHRSKHKQVSKKLFCISKLAYPTSTLILPSIGMVMMFPLSNVTWMVLSVHFKSLAGFVTTMFFRFSEKSPSSRFCKNPKDLLIITTESSQFQPNLFFQFVFKFYFLLSLEFWQNVIQNSQLFFCKNIVQVFPDSNHHDKLQCERLKR